MFAKSVLINHDVTTLLHISIEGMLLTARITYIVKIKTIYLISEVNFVSDIDECEDHRLCAHICTDRTVGYECSCHPGYQVHPKDPHLCSDIDECKDRPCSQTCRNLQGSYVCSCVDGYVLRADKRSCKSNSSKPESHVNIIKCLNTVTK
jgi:hypothetical protein